MTPARTKKTFTALVALALVAALMFWLWPAPLAVEVAEVAVGELQVTVDDDGETRARDRFMVSTPVAGRVARIELREGDPIKEGQLVAEIWPLPLSARERVEQLAHISAVEAQVREAGERVRRLQADYDQARRDSERMRKLAADGLVSKQEAEQARVSETTAANELGGARFHVRSAEAELKAARAALLALDAAPGRAARVQVRSPAAGQVLRILEKSERIVAAGQSLMTIGDPRRIEIVIDVLSTDAVRIQPGMPMIVEGWGGATPLRARVRLVEPFAFTKVSALGVEEQRVNVIGDFIDPPGALGDAYRVEARIVIWSADTVLKVPVSALFRAGQNWAVFVVEEGRARRREITIGERNAFEAHVLEGLQAGETVIRYPSNDISDGVRVGLNASTSNELNLVEVHSLFLLRANICPTG